MKKLKYWIIPLLLLCLYLAFCAETGGKRSDVYLYDFMATENMETFTVDVGVASSAGYIRTLSANQKADGVYVTFYSTYGFNNSIGAKSSFPINLGSTCDKIYFYRGGEEKWDLVLQKDSVSGEWERIQ